jgi:crotonobetainyl-CoA:carnitine CoA-transferase CaiB-like acyl-CoA transferase
VEILGGAGIACGVHLSPAQALAHPHMAARGSFGEVEDAGGAFAVLNPPFRFGDTPRAAPALVARLGEHTTEILSALEPAPLA